MQILTQQVIERIQSSLWPLQNKFLSKVAGNSDLYGLLAGFVLGVSLSRAVLDQHDTHLCGGHVGQHC